MRYFEIHDNRISMYRLVEFKNHTRPHWKARYVKSFLVKNKVLKNLLAIAWISRII